jgi:NAD dependent epimerase/dehydratase family enzyme
VLSRSRGDVRWDPNAGPAPADALAGRDAVVHLAGEDIAQRWNDGALTRIRSSREQGTRNLVEGLRAADPRPTTLVTASAVGYYGHRPDPVDEDARRHGPARDRGPQRAAPARPRDGLPPRAHGHRRGAPLGAA